MTFGCLKIHHGIRDLISLSQQRNRIQISRKGEGEEALARRPVDGLAVHEPVGMEELAALHPLDVHGVGEARREHEGERGDLRDRRAHERERG